MTLSDLLEKTKGFTPGVWEAHEFRVANVNGETGLFAGVICDTANNKASRTAENKANAELIAAAPYLLTLAQEQAAQLEAIAAEPDWHAFYTEVETKRYGLAEKVEAAEKEIAELRAKLDSRKEI